MSLYHTDDEELPSDPMDLIEAIVNSDDRFNAERAEDGDVQFCFKSAWTEAAGYFSYRTELPALLFTLGFDLQASPERMTATTRLAAMINENLWLGHFDVWSDDGSIIFRHAAPMIGRDEKVAGIVASDEAPLSHRFKAADVGLGMQGVAAWFDLGVSCGRIVATRVLGDARDGLVRRSVLYLSRRQLDHGSRARGCDQRHVVGRLEAGVLKPSVLILDDCGVVHIPFVG